MQRNGKTRSTPRVDGQEKVSGTALYAADVGNAIVSDLPKSTKSFAAHG